MDIEFFIAFAVRIILILRAAFPARAIAIFEG